MLGLSGHTVLFQHRKMSIRRRDVLEVLLRRNEVVCPLPT